MNRFSLLIAGASATVLLASCHDSKLSDVIDIDPGEQTEHTEDYYAGGELGTTSYQNAYAYQQPAPAVEKAGMQMEFQNGETIFERDFNYNTSGAFTGLGPLAVRVGCLYCHPAYGHGKRMTQYKASDMGNGYLLVIYDKQTNSYIQSVAGMPQTIAEAPFKTPIDENGIKMEWKQYTDEWGNTLPDGTRYDLIYPEVTIAYSAYYSPVTVSRDGKLVQLTESEYNDQIGIRLETTIGIYGTGMTDAIPDDSITAQWLSESKYFNSIGKTDALNPAMWDQTNNTWKSYYANTRQGDGTKYVRRMTYALSRGPMLDGPGANAIWNITNVTRSDRRYHYLDLNGKIYAQTAMADPDVQAAFPAYIEKKDPDKKHPEWRTDNVADNIYNYLTSTSLDAEMTDQQYKNLMIWHRGLAVPAARNTTTEAFKNGKKIFTQIGCAACHRPSWTTGDDHLQDPNRFFKSDSDMPRFPHQKIWPYTDFVQHRLFMVNDIRTGWCRTTPLWGRGLSLLCTGAEDRLHDCRARNTLEAIMWHGNAKSDARSSVEKFRQLSTQDREDLILFIESI